jgi:hypothetical protein
MSKDETHNIYIGCHGGKKNLIFEVSPVHI